MKRLELLEERLLVSALYIFKEMALIRSYEFVPEMANTVLDKPNLTIERANGGIYYGFVGQPETLIEFNSVSLSAMLYSIENGDETFFVFEGLKAMPLYELKEHIEFIEGYGETEALCTLFSVEDFIQRLKYRIIMGPLSRPRSKILRVAVSRIILSSEASKVKLVGNLVA